MRIAWGTSTGEGASIGPDETALSIANCETACGVCLMDQILKLRPPPLGCLMDHWAIYAEFLVDPSPSHFRLGSWSLAEYEKSVG